MSDLEIDPGRCDELGATVTGDGVNFAVWSRPAQAMDLLLYDRDDDVEPTRVIPLDRAIHRTYHYWHVHVRGLAAGQRYGWWAHGVGEPVPLLDPYGVAIALPATDRPLGLGGPPPKSVVADLAAYDWEGDRPLERPFTRTVIYELHVKGFTAHENSGVGRDLAGTYAGLVAKIPYLQELGVTAVELLPVLAFDRRHAPGGMINYWGYDPISFFAVHPGYAAATDPIAVLDEFRTMVKELHRAGIEVILDVVFNHTGEGGADGPTLSWRGLDPRAYYILSQDDPPQYVDFTGCGNTIDANHSVVRRMITDSLHHWVRHMHVDGFRFDLASVLSRDSAGHPLADPPVVWQIESDPILAGTKLIAEAWDAGGLYQVGSFAGERWREWNGRFRDDIRDVIRGADGVIAHVPERVLASPDLYAARPIEVDHSVNFITAHDGFTLADLVSYATKHNEANGEDNRDGTNDNRSSNWGAEGPTDDPEITALRARVTRSFLAILMISVGCPMLLMGDEVGRTQGGNNNPYNQDNEIAWFDWSLVDQNADLLRFTRMLIGTRLSLDMTTVPHTMALAEFVRSLDVGVHGVRLGEPDLSPDSHAIALSLKGIGGTRQVHAILNAWREPLDFELPQPPTGAPWRVSIDTAAAPPGDIHPLDDGPEVNGLGYLAQPHSVVFLTTPLIG